MKVIKQSFTRQLTVRLVLDSVLILFFAHELIPANGSRFVLCTLDNAIASLESTMDLNDKDKIFNLVRCAESVYDRPGITILDRHIGDDQLVELLVKFFQIEYGFYYFGQNIPSQEAFNQVFASVVARRTCGKVHTAFEYFSPGDDYSAALTREQVKWATAHKVCQSILPALESRSLETRVYPLFRAHFEEELNREVSDPDSFGVKLHDYMELLAEQNGPLLIDFGSEVYDRLIEDWDTLSSSLEQDFLVSNIVREVSSKCQGICSWLYFFEVFVKFIWKPCRRASRYFSDWMQNMMQLKTSNPDNLKWLATVKICKELMTNLRDGKNLVTEAYAMFISRP